MIKDLVVLVDVSSTMGTEFGYVDKTTPLQSALNMTQLLLNTLSGGDRATVILYSTDSSNIGSVSLPQKNNGFLVLPLCVYYECASCQGYRHLL